MEKRFVYMQTYDHDIFRPQFYRTIEEAREAMINDFRKTLIDFDLLDDMTKRYGSLYDIPSGWWDDGNFVDSKSEYPIWFLLYGESFTFNLPDLINGKAYYDARIIDLDSEEE